MDYHAVFNYLSIDIRAELVLQHGQFLALRSETGCHIALYHLGCFFAEVWYSPDDNQITIVQGFENYRLLEKYLDQINLKELME